MACDFPITIANPAAKLDPTAMLYIPVPCRKCPPCLAKRSNGWIFRLLQQDLIADKSLFVTLTYENHHMTKESKRLTSKGYMTLVKRDYQLFMKRLRKITSKDVTLKYFAVGEYGSTTYRPHFHAIIFNSNVDDIEAAWGLGKVHCDSVNGNTVAYTTKYMHKGRLIPVHANDDRTPEFQLISQRLGINYITEDTIRYHNEDITRTYLTGEGGVKIPMPEAYKKRLYSDQTRKAQARATQVKILATEAEKIATYTRERGSPDNYYRDQVESKKASVAAFQNRQKQRNKI